MIVSLEWLKEYIDLPTETAELADRLALAGLNHEMFDDKVIDLEVTSNRPDCLGHIGVAREIGVLYERPFKTPAAKPQATGDVVSQVTSVEITAPGLCPRYTARIIRGVKIGPSPAWLQDRLLAERLLEAVWSARQPTTPAQFFVWSQSRLQVLLPHRLLVCVGD